MMNQRGWLLATTIQSVAIVMLVALVLVPRGAAAPASQLAAAPAAAPPASVAGQRIRIAPGPLSLEEARIIVDTAIAQVRAENGRAAIAVVDEHANLIALDRMDTTPSFFGRIAVAKA